MTHIMPDTEYVCGFLFCRSQVLLLRKRKPDWQAGLLNGVGGKRNPGEWASAAMAREWMEESHGCVVPLIWERFCVEWQPGAKVDYFRATCDEWPAVPSCNDVGERFESHGVDDVSGSLLVVGNLRWLIPLARDWRRLNVVMVYSRDNIGSKPTW